MEHKSSPSQPLDFSAYQKPLTWFSVLQETLGKYTKVVSIVGPLVLFAISLAAIWLVAGGADIPLLITLIIFACIMLAPIIQFWIAFTRQIARAKRSIRLRSFAPANGFTYEPSANTWRLRGMLFTQPSTRSTLENSVSGTYHGMPFLFGNARFVTGSGKNRTERWYGIVQVRLTRHVPHVLLDSRRNNSWFVSNFPGVKRDQRLQLEGDFNEHFDLYVPKGYERDALYFITPELMALLIDYKATFDVELVDDSLIIYSDKAFGLEHAEDVSKVFQMIDRIGAEFQENTQRYADANVGDRAANIVAKPGQRLKTSVPWLLIILIILVIVLPIVL